MVSSVANVAKFSVVASLFFIAAVYNLGFVFRWNYLVWWFDLFLHFLGGVWLGMVAMNVIKPIEQIKPLGLIGPILILAIVALVGVVWEVYEFAVDEIFFEERALWREQEGNTDTMTDLIMDVLGGAVVGLYWSFWSHKTYA